MREEPLIAKLSAGLEKSRDFVQAETPSMENIKDLHETMSHIVTAIATGP